MQEEDRPGQLHQQNITEVAPNSKVAIVISDFYLAKSIITPEALNCLIVYCVLVHLFRRLGVVSAG